VHRLAPRRRRGFTLIELLMVMAVIAILALIALPSFQGKFARENVVEGATLAKLAKEPVAALWATTRVFPDDNKAAGLPEPDLIVNNVVKSIRIENGAVHIVYGNRANGGLQGKTLTLRPAIVEDAPMVPVTWVCGHAKGPDKMKIVGTDRTDIPPILLPINCQ